MDDEFKSIKFRHDGKTYLAKAVDIGGKSRTPRNFLYDIALLRIYDEHGKEMLGGITFRESMLLDFMWANPDKKHFPPDEFLEEALVNLLHYIPFYPEKIKPLYTQGSTCFIYQFVRDKEEGLESDGIFNIKTEDSFESTYRRLIFGEDVTTDTIQSALLEPLYMHWLDNSATGLLIGKIQSMIPLPPNTVQANLELLEDDEFVEINRDSSNNFVSVKIKPKGVKKIVGTLKNDVQSPQVTNNHYGHNIDVKTGDYSPVTINANTVDSVFSGFRAELEKENPDNKTEISQAVDVLQHELKQKKKDEGKIKGALTTISKGCGWLYEKITNNQLIATILAQYALHKLGLPSSIVDNQ